VPQVVREDWCVEGFDVFLVEPALAAGMVLSQLLKVWPAGHLESTHSTMLQNMLMLKLHLYEKCDGFIVCTYSPDVATDHQANVLGEGVNQVCQCRTGGGVANHHQALGPTR